MENEDVVGAAPTGDAPTTSEGSTSSLPTQVRLILRDLTVGVKQNITKQNKKVKVIYDFFIRNNVPESM